MVERYNAYLKDLGVHQPPSLHSVVKASDYDDLHGGMLEWERQALAAYEHIAALVDALKNVERYGLDTLSGRVDGPDDRAWQRACVNEMVKRARVGLNFAPVPKDDDCCPKCDSEICICGLGSPSITPAEPSPPTKGADHASQASGGEKS